MEDKSNEQLKKNEVKLSFQPGVLKMIIPEDLSKPIIKEVEIKPEIAGLFGMPVLTHTMQAESKTMSFQGKLFINGRSEPIATLDDVKVTAIKFTNPQSGVPYIRVFLDYFVTSHGFRTGRGAPTGEPLSAPQGLYFKNSAGGIIHSWGFPQDEFMLSCNWNREHRMHTFTDTNYVGWFDLWEGVTHEVRGVFFKC